MAKIAYLTDIHWGCRANSLHFLEYMKSYFEQEFFPYLVDNGIKTIVCGGDFVDNRNGIGYRTLRYMKEAFFDQLAKNGITMHVIVGNHDIFYRHSNTINALSELEPDNLTHIKVYTKPEEVEIEGVSHLMLPWINRENEEESLQAVADSKAKICVGHLEIAGAKMYKNSVSEHGLDRELFKKFDWVVSGHYHHRSTVGNLTYIGAMFALNWQDYNDPRGYAVYDTTTEDVEYIDIPDDCSLFTRVYFDVNMDVDWLKEDYSFMEGRYVQLVVVDKGDGKVYKKLMKMLLEVDTIDLNIIDQTVKELNIESTEEIDVELDTFGFLRNHIESTDVDVDKNSLLELAKSVYEEAQQQANV